MPTEEADEGHDMSTRQGDEDIDLTEECVDPATTSQPLKQPRNPDKPVPRKKVKASKTFINPIMLTEGDLFDIGEIVCDVNKDALQEVMTQHKTLLGVLSVQLHGL